MQPTTASLGRLVPVPLREVWAHEANDFTPWLAESENLSLLSDALGLGELELQGTEVAVGDFSIDILARDREGSLVVIENQFGATDHRHLGQMMTYAAGQEGKVTVIWVAEKFREEHRAAIDWLNASTIDGFHFFAVEVEALKIGDSLPAPRFNVLGKPNEWSRGVARAVNGERLDQRQKAYLAYWTAFATFLADRNAPFKPKTVSRDYWCGFGPVGRPGFLLVATAGLRDRRLGVEIYIQSFRQAFDRLAEDRAAIDAEFGSKLEWQRPDDKKFCRIAIYRTDLDPGNPEQVPQQHAWMLDQLSRFDRVFRERIGALDVALMANGDEP